MEETGETGAVEGDIKTGGAFSTMLHRGEDGAPARQHPGDAVRKARDRSVISQREVRAIRTQLPNSIAGGADRVPALADAHQLRGARAKQDPARAQPGPLLDGARHQGTAGRGDVVLNRIRIQVALERANRGECQRMVRLIELSHLDE